MKMTEPPNSQKIGEISTILEEMKQKGNLKGIILIYRDGGVIVENVEKDFETKEFAAMCASVLESSEAIGTSMSNRSIGKIIAELEKETVIIKGCTPNFFITLIIENDSVIGSILNELNEYITKIINIYE